MSTLVESLKRLYHKERISKEDVAERVATGKITETEYQYITGEEYEG